MYGNCRRRYEAFDPGSVYSRNVVPYYNYTGGGIYWDNIKALQQNETVEAYRMKGQTFDCGSKLGYLKAVLYYGIEHPKLGEDFKGLIKELAL